MSLFYQPLAVQVVLSEIEFHTLVYLYKCVSSSGQFGVGTHLSCITLIETPSQLFVGIQSTNALGN